MSNELKAVCGKISELLECILNDLYIASIISLVFELHEANNVKVLNFHCPHFKTCLKSQFDDCFLCVNNPKCEEYVKEKIYPKIIEEMMKNG